MNHYPFSHNEASYPQPIGMKDQSQTSSIKSVIVVATLFLMVAHLAVKEFFPNPVFWVIGASLIMALGLVWIVIRKDSYGFLLALFVCVHFDFAYNQGGLWAYVICAVILSGTLFRRLDIKLSAVPMIFNVFVIIFIFMQVLGTLLNPYSLVSNIQASVITAAQVLAFYLCASQKITTSILKCFLSLWFLIVCWVFLMGLNQRYQWLITASPILPQRKLLSGFAHVPSGSFGNTELFAEYFCIIFSFSLIVLSHIEELKVLKIRKIFPVIMVLISLSAVLMGGSRSAVVLVIVATFHITFLDFFIKPSIRILRRFIIILSILSLAIILVLNFGSYLFIDQMVDDFKDVDISNLSTSSILSGKSINRGGLFDCGLERLKQGSWWVGYGYNLPENNAKTLGVQKMGVKDFHSLYLSLPFYYGWLGTIAYILLLIGTALRIYLIYFRGVKKTESYFIPIALGFSMLWGIFILDQYKIGATRNPNYYLLTWMWLGMTHAIANAICDRLTEAKTKE